MKKGPDSQKEGITHLERVCFNLLISGLFSLSQGKLLNETTHLIRGWVMLLVILFNKVLLV